MIGDNRCTSNHGRGSANILVLDTTTQLQRSYSAHALTGTQERRTQYKAGGFNVMANWCGCSGLLKDVKKI